MRGTDSQQAHMFRYAFGYVSPERRMPADHPLRPIRVMVDAALAQLSRRLAPSFVAGSTLRGVRAHLD